MDVFNTPVSRKGTYCTQWDFCEDRFGVKDVLPFSISDMDLPIPEVIIRALRKRLEHPILGYSRWQHGEYLNAIVNWYYQQYQTDIKPEWITYSPSVMYSIAKAIELLTSHGDNILVFTPVYNAFFDVIKHSERNILTASLIIKNEGATLSTGKILILRLKAQRWCYYVILITRQEQSGRKKNCIKSLQAVQGIMSGYVQMKSIVILFLIVALHPRLK